MLSYAQILSLKWPNNQWRIDGDDYSSLWWSKDNSVAKPTKKEIESSIIEADLIYQWAKVRHQRDTILKNTDWTQLKDAPRKNQTKWKKYRQELRDIPQSFDDPDFVIWPTEPK